MSAPEARVRVPVQTGQWTVPPSVGTTVDTTVHSHEEIERSLRRLSRVMTRAAVWRLAQEDAAAIAPAAQGTQTAPSAQQTAVAASGDRGPGARVIPSQNTATAR